MRGIQREGTRSRRALALPGALALAWALSLALGLAPDAGAQAPEPTREEAQELLEVAKATAEEPPGTPAEPSRELTLVLRDLALALPALRGDDRREAQALLARPPASCGPPDCPAGYNDAGKTEGYGAEWSVAATGTRLVHDTPHFRVHYVTVGQHATTTTFAEEVGALAEQSYLVQNDELGWPVARGDGNAGGDIRVDIYLSDLCGSGSCIFGYASSTPSPSCQAPGYRCAAYLVLDNDYAEFTQPDEALQATVAHEYNHVLQFAIDAVLDRWMFESTATWVEEYVFPDSDDWLRTYVPGWARTSRQPITDTGGGGGLRVYGTALWNHWLSGRYGTDVILRSWRNSRRGKPKHFGVGAYDIGIKRTGGGGFSQEFTRFAAATSEWRTGAGNLPDSSSYPDVKRKGSLKPGQSLELKLDHAAYQLVRVVPGRARDLVLRLRAPRGTRSGVALVARKGKPRQGSVVRRIRYLPKGGSRSVRLGKVRRFRRITAVVVNADGRVRGFSGGDRHYVRDRQRYVLRLSRR